MVETLISSLSKAIIAVTGFFSPSLHTHPTRLFHSSPPSSLFRRLVVRSTPLVLLPAAESHFSILLSAGFSSFSLPPIRPSLRRLVLRSTAARSSLRRRSADSRIAMLGTVATSQTAYFN
ncbi:unnamed protein product [Microthlaspi erraticum]|uniref:Uncharacterized protein n=1 Tax=Microthlaspi erraticum TaxID=1685480 RepID=A0A6D2KR68_9BRAS|nr:unnamed protein product [Microthlaspi erraticum]